MTGPLLVIGSGLGAMASQLGSVTVSAVPEEQSGEVGGLQNTGSQLGASIGTALAGAILISALSTAFFSGVQNNPAVPDNLVVNAQSQLATGVPFVSDKQLKAALDKAHVPTKTANAVVDENAKARIAGLRSALAVLALISLLALLFTRGLPTVQPGAEAKPNAPPTQPRRSDGRRLSPDAWRKGPAPHEACRHRQLPGSSDRRADMPLRTTIAGSPLQQETPPERGLSEWAIQDSNLGPLPYQRSALTD